MIINSSYVNMVSDRQYRSYSRTESVTLTEVAGSEVKVDLSAKGQSLIQQVKKHQEEQEELAKELQDRLVKEQLEQMKKDNKKDTSKVLDVGDLKIKSPEDLKAELLKKLFKAFRKNIREGIRLDSSEYIEESERQKFSLNSILGVNSVGAISGKIADTVIAGQTRMVRTTVSSTFESEVENTAFTANGGVQTADGRSISFNVTLEMSRAFCREYESFSQQEYIQVDPLVINMDNDTAKLSDIKFMFDLDADGEEEKISFTEQGSGFLAYDKNGDGIINDGSELFGTKSGDGFRDLAAYDDDGNGWIDEADNIFQKLKIWTLDDNGEKILVDLKKAGIGAIYLGSADTQFTLDNAEGSDKNGFIQKTGVYLHEDGRAGTVQHVDLIC